MRRPGQDEDESEFEGGRAAERLREFREGRFGAEDVSRSGERGEQAEIDGLASDDEQSVEEDAGE